MPTFRPEGIFRCIPGKVEEVLKHQPQVTGIADDCLITGKTELDHDVTLLTLLQAARLNGIKFNEKK